MEFGSQPSLEEAFVQRFEGIEDAFSGTVSEGLGHDVVAIVVVQDHDVVVPFGGRSDEASGLVRKDLSRGGFGLKNFDKACMGAVGYLVWKRFIRNGSRIVGIWWDKGRSFGRSKVLLDLIEVALGRGNGLRGVAMERLGAKARKSGHVATPEGVL